MNRPANLSLHLLYQNRKDDMLSNADTTLGEREEMEKKKKRDELFERERQERIQKLQKWKVSLCEESADVWF